MKRFHSITLDEWRGGGSDNTGVVITEKKIAIGKDGIQIAYPKRRIIYYVIFYFIMNYFLNSIS